MSGAFGRVKAACGVAACGLLILSATVAFADDDQGGQWTMGGQNLSNWRNQRETGINPWNVAKLTPKWTFTTGSEVSATPSVANGIVYFPDFAGNFYAVNADSGKLVWQQQVATWTGVTGDYARNDPAIDGNTLILGNQGGQNAFWNSNGTPPQYVGTGAMLIAVDANTGNKKWVTQVESFPTAVITGSPVIYNGVAYVGIASAEEGTALGLGTPCCVSRGSVVAVDVKTGKIKWQTYMVPDNGGSMGGYSGGGVWDSTPAIDPKRNSVYVGTGNNYSVPSTVKTCFTKNNTNPNCADPKDYFDSVVALDLDTGKVKWAKRALYYDAFNDSCLFIYDPTTNFFGPGPGPNCPVPTGPDYDFGGAGPNLVSIGDLDIVGIGEKSGIYWALNADNGTVVWKTQVGPGSGLGGIQWGTATDGNRIYVPISNFGAVTYQLRPSGASVNSGSWAALDPWGGHILWQTATPGACSTPATNVAQGCMALGPASVADGVVFAGSTDTNSANPTMFALDAMTGKILWQYAAGTAVRAGPAIVGNSVYWGSGYGSGTASTLFAFSIGESRPKP